MHEIEQWVSAQIDACRPDGGAMDPMNRLANACVRLKGEGSATLFGLQPPDDLLPHELLYRKACDVLAAWFEKGDDAEGEALAWFVRLHDLDVAIPDRFPPPAPPPAPEPATPEQVQAMAARISRLAPLWEKTEWESLRQRWDELLASVTEQGGAVHSALEIGEPETVEELARAQRDLDRELPDELLRVFLTAKRVALLFSFPPGVPADEGGYDESVWCLDDVPGLYEESRAWALDEEDEEDRIWVEAIPFAGINGSYLAIWNGAVVFLEHENDYLLGHGVTLAPDFRSFIEAWTRCGCPNAADWWKLKAFTSTDGLLDPESEAARTMRRALGLG